MSTMSSIRPNKAELESRLYHAYVRAHARRVRESAAPSATTATSGPRKCTTAASLLQRILAPTPVPGALPAFLAWALPPSLPETRTESDSSADSDAPLLATRLGSRPNAQNHGDFTIHRCSFALDPPLTPGHVFVDTFARTPGADRPKARTTHSEYFPGNDQFEHLDLLPDPTPCPWYSTVVGLGATGPVSVLDSGVGVGDAQVVGLGISGVDLGLEEGRVEQYFPTI